MLVVGAAVDITLHLAAVVVDRAEKDNLIMLLNCQLQGWPTLAGAVGEELLPEFLQVQWPAAVDQV